ncbi:hypothetical protein Poly41_14040 [Novipirellula artificiosorum]|uniref:Uncharacterized protein n=1 Tax=Novipirellula artificiosorum TaxID=2528016 RepID=A0A5C6DYT4_9BACT|nr:hypothetical protein Poly41_14040 [Novipirellula artificiosorum]
MTASSSKKILENWIPTFIQNETWIQMPNPAACWPKSSSPWPGCDNLHYVDRLIRRDQVCRLISSTCSFNVQVS